MPGRPLGPNAGYVFKSTPRKGPIMGEYASPGPQYMLPSTIGLHNHDFTRVKSPAHSIVGKPRSNLREAASPGPAAYNTSRNVPTGGTTISGRQKEHYGTVTPGPGQYRPENQSDARYRRQPAYTMGVKNRNVTDMNRSPGPAAYNTSVFSTHKSPAYSLASRTRGVEDGMKSPGPCAYQTTNPSVYRVKSPAYSISGKATPLSRSTIKPGPGAYRPEDVYFDKPYSPAYTFGVKHSAYMGVPGLEDERKRDVGSRRGGPSDMQLNNNNNNCCPAIK